MLNGGTDIDAATYASATAGVRVDLALTGAQNTVGAGIDTLNSIEDMDGSDFADTLTGNLATMTAQLTTTSARLDSVLASVNSGRGSIGKFATDTGFYTDIRELSQSMKRLLDELQKHPGKVPVTVKLF